MTADLIVGGWASKALPYLDAGWNPLPLGHMKKKSPPAGSTGRHGMSVTKQDLQEWDKRFRGGNLALRMPRNVIGIDVDQYADKRGRDRITELEQILGVLPPTWFSTNRDDGMSGIWFYRIPEGKELPGGPCPAVEFIQYHHRYALVAPSVHPEGRRYQWFTPEGEPADRVPAVGELPELPTAWLEHDYNKPVSTQVDKSDRTASLHAVSPPAVGLQGVVDTYNRASGSRHDAMVKATYALSRLVADKEPGAEEALERIHRHFISAVTGDGSRTPEEAKKEWDDAVRTAPSKNAANGAPPKEQPAPRVPRFVSAEDVPLSYPRMLVRGWMPAGAITLLAGRPGAGKGVVMADLVARGSRGYTMPNGDRITKPFTTTIVCAPGEDGAEDWKLRLLAANADLKRVRIVEETLDDLAYDYPVRAADIGGIIDAAAAAGDELVVIDSLGGISDAVDLNKTEVRDQFLNPVARQARNLGITIVLIHHVRKSGGDILEVVSGSTQIVAACRSVMVVVQERDSETQTRFLAVAKLNAAKKSENVAFTTSGRSIIHDAGKLLDDRGEVVYVPTVSWDDRKVSDAEVSAASNNIAIQPDEVADLMRELLANGPMRSSALEAELADAGFSKDQVKRTRQRIGAGTIRIGYGDLAGWWVLPAGMPKTEGREAIERREAA